MHERNAEVDARAVEIIALIKGVSDEIVSRMYTNPEKLPDQVLKNQIRLKSLQRRTLVRVGVNVGF